MTYKNTEKIEISENCIYSWLKRRFLSSLKMMSCKIRREMLRGHMFLKVCSTEPKSHEMFGDGDSMVR